MKDVVVLVRDAEKEGWLEKMELARACDQNGSIQVDKDSDRIPERRTA